jgi:transcriptional regulator GlxA family with amidase domain
VSLFFFSICAAPYVLANAGILDGRHATTYPTYKDRLGKVVYEEQTVVEDGNVMTSRGPGTALCFGLSIVAKLVGKEKAQQIRQAMLLEKVCDWREVDSAESPSHRKKCFCWWEKLYLFLHKRSTLDELSAD